MRYQKLSFNVNIVFLCVLAGMVSVQADLIPLIDRAQFDGRQIRVGNFNYEAGNRFTTGNNPPTVTALGFIDMDNSNVDNGAQGANDGDGLKQSHRVTLWLVHGQSKMAEVIVPAGTAGMLIDGFRYAELDVPIKLMPNTEYIISARNGSASGDAYVNAVSPENAPAPFFVGSNTNHGYGWKTPSNQMPTNKVAGSFYGLANVLADSESPSAIVSEDFTFYSSLDGTGPIIARAVYHEQANNFPMMAVQHGYRGFRDNVMYSAMRMAKRGYFCVLVDYRGCGGSAGLNDDGGLEVLDIYDGIVKARQNYPGKIDPDLTSIVGYSGGGGHTFFSTLRCPFLFRASLAFFGVVDYGQWAELVPTRQDTVWPSVGGSPAEVPDKYFVRRAEEGASNLSGTQFHIAYDEAEWQCPPVMDEEFVAAVPADKLDDVSVHISLTTDANRWTHSYNKIGHLNAMEDLFMDDIENNNLQTPVMPDDGSLIVMGYLITPKFKCYFGTGDNSAATVNYHFDGDRAMYEFAPLTSDSTATGILALVPSTVDYDVQVCINGVESVIIPQGQPLAIPVGIGSFVKIRPFTPSDISGNCEIDLEDFIRLAERWLDVCDLGNNWCDGADLNQLNGVDFDDFRNISKDWTQ